MPGVDINWSLLTDSSARLGDAIGDVGKAIGEGRKRKAVANYLAAPDDPVAFQKLLKRDPDMALAARKAARGEADYQRGNQFRNALSEWLNGGKLPPASTGAAGPAVAPGTTGAASPAGLGTPDPVTRMNAFDPEKSMEVQGKRAKLTKEQLDNYQELNNAAIRLLAGVHDQASYDDAKQRAMKMYGKFGMNLADHGLPDVYDPEVIKQEMLSTLAADKQLAALRAERRLEWDIEDDEVDNSRADRDLDDRIHDRGARRGLMVRGQDVASGDRRRGQDIGADTTRRGQDLADKRVREGYGSRGRRTGRRTPGPAGGGSDYQEANRRAADGGASVPAGSPLAPPTRPAPRPSSAPRIAMGQTATNAAGKKVRWNGKGWVPVR